MTSNVDLKEDVAVLKQRLEDYWVSDRQLRETQTKSIENTIDSLSMKIDQAMIKLGEEVSSGAVKYEALSNRVRDLEEKKYQKLNDRITKLEDWKKVFVWVGSFIPALIGSGLGFLFGKIFH